MPLKEYVSANNIILMNFTETWLKKKMQDEKIPNFTTFRCDRKSKKSKGGGTAIYLKNGLEGRLLLEDYLGYLGGFTVTRLILFVYDSGATPRGHRLVRMIAAWC